MFTVVIQWACVVVFKVSGSCLGISKPSVGLKLVGSEVGEFVVSRLF